VYQSVSVLVMADALYNLEGRIWEGRVQSNRHQIGV
jgi:hypothetical protein